MTEMTAAGDRIAACFGMNRPKTLVTTPLRTARLSITDLFGKVSAEGQGVTLPAEDAYLVMLYLSDVLHCDILPDASPTFVKTYPAGSICLISLKQGAAICLRSDFAALAFHIPTSLLDEVTDEAGEPLLEGLLTCRGIDDPVISNLGAALLPLFDSEGSAAAPYVAHVGLAFNAHIAHRYGRLPSRHALSGRKLSPLQEKRAKDFMIANFQRDVRLGEVALAIGLPKEDLIRGFRNATGQEPFRWLDGYRIERAKTLLTETGLRLDAVARECGFADEDKMADAFLRDTAITPSAWRLRERH